VEEEGRRVFEGFQEGIGMMVFTQLGTVQFQDRYILNGSSWKSSLSNIT
jgi:hypothetical protein